MPEPVPPALEWHSTKPWTRASGASSAARTCEETMALNHAASHLEAVRIVGLPVDHFHDVLVILLALSVARSPVVARAAALFGDENILCRATPSRYSVPARRTHPLARDALTRIEKITMRRGLNLVHHLRARVHG